VLFPQQALDERVPGGRIVLCRAPSSAKARIEPLGLDDKIETRNVGENDTHLFPATFVPAAVLGPVVVARSHRRVDLAVGPTDTARRDRPTTFFTTAATTAAVSFFPIRFAGASDGHGRRTRIAIHSSIHESVQDRMSAVIGDRFVSKMDRSGGRCRIPQRQFQGRGCKGITTVVTFPRPQQASDVHVHPPSTAATREVGDKRRCFP